MPIDLVDAGMMPGDLAWLEQLEEFGVVAYAGSAGSAGSRERAAALRRALARRDGEIKPLVTEILAPQRYLLERLVCFDTTAAGGNAALLAASEGAGKLSVPACS